MTETPERQSAIACLVQETFLAPIEAVQSYSSNNTNHQDTNTKMNNNDSDKTGWQSLAYLTKIKPVWLCMWALWFMVMFAGFTMFLFLVVDTFNRVVK